VLQSVAVCVAVCAAHFSDGNVDTAPRKQGKVYSWHILVLQYLAVCYSASQCVAVCVAVCVAHFSDRNVDVALGKQGKGIHYILQRCSVLQCVAVCCSVLQCVAVCCSVLQCVAVRCRALQCVGSVLQCVAV